MSRQTIVILSVSAGAGHVRAAQAIQAYAEKNYPDIQAIHIDVMELVPRWFKYYYAESYIKIVNKHPALWLYMYEKTDFKNRNSIMTKIFQATERMHTGKLLRELEKINPDHVICTHFLPSQLLSREIQKGKWNKPVWVQVTDFDIHGLWIHPHISGYFVASEEVAARLHDRGIEKEKIHVTGISVMPVFSESHSREECAKEIGANPNKFTILMLSGGAGVGGIDKLVEKILLMEGDFQIIAISGRNEKLLDNLKSIATRYPHKLFPIGFTRTIERPMSCSDIAITKPGGLTTSECLAVGLPMIIVSAIPGQEEKNANYLLENGLALRAFDDSGLIYRLNQLIHNPDKIQSMKRNIQLHAKPKAAEDVLRIVLNR